MAGPARRLVGLQLPGRHTDTNAPSAIANRLQRWNLPETLVRPVIERLWEAIDQADDWQPFHGWLARTVVQDD